jgi:fumarylacetoacetate (FAA) hydrolase
MPQACSEGTEDTMKLATYKDGSRDGQLVVVSRDLGQAHYATGIASRMQQVLDDWSYMAPQLQDLYHLLNSGKAPHAFAFDPRQCMAPLPRAQGPRALPPGCGRALLSRTFRPPAGPGPGGRP